MKFYLKNRKGTFNAIADYNEKTKKFIVLKGSHVNKHICNSPKFRGANTVAKLREEYVNIDVVIKEVEFKSPSTAANFVTGSSTNGCIAWKDEHNNTFNDIFGDRGR